MGIGKRIKIRRMARKGARNLKQLAACQGKVRYKNYDEASKAADLKPSIVHPYKCQFCGNYHIGRKK